jgi:hypothetical protein
MRQGEIGYTPVTTRLPGCVFAVFYGMMNGTKSGLTAGSPTALRGRSCWVSWRQHNYTAAQPVTLPKSRGSGNLKLAALETNLEPDIRL